MSRAEPKQRPRGRRKPIEHEDISHPHQHHPQHHPQHPHPIHHAHHAPHHHAPHLRHPSHYDDTSSSEELQHQHHHIRQHQHQHRRQGSHNTRIRGRRVPAQTEEQSSTGEEDHIDPYQHQQHHIQHSHSHTYPVTDYYDADGHLITSEPVYYEEGDGQEDGAVYEDGAYVEGGVYDDGTYEEDIGYDDQATNYPPTDLADDTETRGTRLPRGENDDTSQTYNPDNLPLWVFLGGSCDPTTWRRDIAVPQLKQARIPFYNPQIDDWHPELIQNEARAKEECSMLLFVIDSKTRAIASMLEATEHIMRKRNVVLVILDVVEGTRIDGELVGARQLKDLNRARAFLCDIAARHQEHCDVFDQVQTAIAHIIDTYPGPPNKSTPSTPSHATTNTNEIVPALSSLSLQADTPTSTQSGETSQPSDSHRNMSPSLSPSPSPSDSSTTPLMTATSSTPVASPQPIHV